MTRSNDKLAFRLGYFTRERWETMAGLRSTNVDLSLKGCDKGCTT